jgi:hypothetical protein
MNAKPTATDLQLYLAGALPPFQRILLTWALLVDGELRSELRAQRDLNASFRSRELPRLRQALFPGRQSGPARERGLGKLPSLMGAMALLVLCALPWLPSPENPGSGPEVIAKGRGLGVNLFVKGDTAYRVENQSAYVGAGDTLQVIPLGTEAQQLVLLGWDARQGLVRLFPKDGDRSRRVSRRDPPPALLLQDVDDNRLICVTAVNPFRIADAEAALRGKPFLSMEKAPPSHLHKGLYLQIFSITKAGARI